MVLIAKALDNLVMFSKEPKCVTTSNKFTFLLADIIQSDVILNLSLASDWLMIAQNKVNSSNVVMFELLVVIIMMQRTIFFSKIILLFSC